MQSTRRAFSTTLQRSIAGTHGNGVVGMVSEVYNKWERRAPLCPEHVQRLTKENGLRVLVEPSNRRVFSDAEYEAAGAEITSDLTPCGTIFGVKQVPVENLLPDRTYVFFSHVIKAQPENMELLDTILEKNVRLIDYECINQDGLRSAPRLIAFGGYAGRAGIIDGLRGLGERFLSLGYSTPFLSLGSSYMYTDLPSAKEAVQAVGKGIYANGLGGIPKDFAPLVIGFTGNGNVSQGAQEIFRLLPHKFVEPKDLPHLPKTTDKVYGVIAEEEHLVKKKDGSPLTDRSHYYAHPEEYVSAFHEDVAPYLTMLVNCTYWDHRYPRVLTVDQMKYIRETQKSEGVEPKLQMVADISCDIGGSIEFLAKSTHIEAPFFRYTFGEDQQDEEEIENDSNVVDDMDGPGVMMCGVDILPSELPRESSKHFGDLLYDMVEDLAKSDGSMPFDEQSDLPLPLKGACIAAHGELTPNFNYISAMRSERDREEAQTHARRMYESAGSTVLRIRGHLFDTNLINLILDLLEEEQVSFYVVELDVRPNDQFGDHAPISSADIQISVEGGRERLENILQKVNTLVTVTPKSEAEMIELPWDYCGGNFTRTLHDWDTRTTEKDSAGGVFLSPGVNASVREDSSNSESEDVLVLGAGLVASPAIEYLARKPGRTVTVVSGVPGEATRLKNSLGNPPNVVPLTLDVVGQADDIRTNIERSSAVLSLLPATMHVPIIQHCIHAGVPAITASYVNEEMQALDAAARAAGVPVLNEMGLDPGMDHMSAMKVIHEVQSNGGKISSFSSLCGGLPAPEAANNPLMYKFSWSPLGVLRAAQNSSQYLNNNKIIQVDGSNLLSSAQQTGCFPTLSLEHLPNRDSLPYGDIYGISDASQIYRGTLRYAGWSLLMEDFRKIGLTTVGAAEERGDLPTTWGDLMSVVHSQGEKASPEAQRCLQWLGCYSDAPVTDRSSILNAFCALLQEKLAYEEGERDMVLMQHEFGITYDDERPDEVKTSSMLLYGEPHGDTAMAKTVGLTIAVGAELVLGGAGKGGGILIPTTPELYNPGLDMLAKEGLIFNEQTRLT